MGARLRAGFGNCLGSMAAASCCVFLSATGLSLAMSPFTKVVSFGDSLSDQGNYHAATGIPPFPYWQGRVSDGPVWVDVVGAPPIQYNIPVPLAPVFWGDDVGLDSPAETLALAKRTLAQIDVWPPHRGYLSRCVRPRLGIVQPGAAMGPEHLLLSYQSIHLFPAALPDLEIMMENIAAEGGFRISAVRTAAGEIRDVQIHSTRGGQCPLANPWSTRAVEATSADGTRVAAFDAGQACLTLPTRPGGSYRLRPRY